jgi:hypothetical protein
MQFPKSPHADGWHARMPQLRPRPHHGMLVMPHGETPSPQARRRFHALAIAVALSALTASAGLAAVNDARPLDEQLSAAMHRAGSTLHHWQGQIARGLQVSLRAVADGRDAPAASAPLERQPVANTLAAVDADDRDQPVARSVKTAAPR